MGKSTLATALAKSTPGECTAMTDLALTRLDLVHPGKETFPLATDVRAVSAARLTADILPLAGPRRRSAGAGGAEP